MNHYGSIRNNNVEYDESDVASKREDDTRRMNATDDQLRDMLHSRVYKDGQWQKAEKPNEGPKDLSNQSLGDLLQLEKGQKSSKKKTKKTKNKGRGDAIPEEDGDDDVHGHKSPPKDTFQSDFP